MPRDFVKRNFINESPILCVVYNRLNRFNAVHRVSVLCVCNLVHKALTAFFFFSNSHKKWIWLSFLCARVCVCRSNSLLVFVPNKKVNCFLTALLRLASFPIQSPISWCYCSFLWKSKLEFVILEEFEFEGRRRRKRRKDEANEKVAWKRVVNMGCSSHWAQRFPQQLLLFLLRVGGCVYNLCY